MAPASRAHRFSALIGVLAACAACATSEGKTADPDKSELAWRAVRFERELASPDSNANRLGGFRQGLKDTGYVEGENVAIEYRWAGSAGNAIKLR